MGNKISDQNTQELLSYEQLKSLTAFIRNVHGFDFSDYSAASLKRRVTRIMQLQKLSLFDLRTLLTNDLEYFESFLMEVTVNVTEMFRDPLFYKSLITNIIPYLQSYQRIKVWNAGCSTGEELYSFAILFAEEGLYNRSFFYGTDINADVLEFSKNGIYDLQKMKQYSENYQQTGALHTLSDYYSARYGAASMNHSLKKNILFSAHNLASDGVFNEFQLISCRNVLIYFNTALQERVIDLFYNSLANFGFLCLGSKETLRSSEIGRFRIIDQKNNIYQKIA
ncbi:CheR family methyltransferase [Pedobacter hartonius]|uniref:Chemotaxis protein methyltransferase CheR n=1 Tax=Pedobacter hartonius TaxID=425514 RepID=A0A1H3YUB5_9SPHI|nr:protein-glutamate O-methyltransferase CheR [Pedobacter hartonius]SEA15000.1 chemotaxis protein methyltransferase CheR [Pedobacter hartonius]